MTIITIFRELKILWVPYIITIFRELKILWVPYIITIFRELKILWVPSFKAGSSTWRDYFIDATKEENSTEHKPYKLDLLEERKLEKTVSIQ